MSDDAKTTDKARRDAILRLLARVPERAEREAPDSRWIVRDKKKTDPDSVY